MNKKYLVEMTPAQWSGIVHLKEQTGGSAAQHVRNAIMTYLQQCNVSGVQPHNFTIMVNGNEKDEIRS